MTTGRINQVARDEPPPETHAHNPQARASARTRTRSARSNDGTPGIRHLRPTHKPHAQPDAKPHPTRRIARPHDAPNSRRRCAKDTHATHDGATRTPRPHDHAATPHARALARARTRRRTCHTPDTPCVSAQTALTQDTRAAHLATTRTKLEPNAHPPRRSSHPAHAIKRAAKQLTPRNGRHSGRDHRRPRPGA